MYVKKKEGWSHRANNETLRVEDMNWGGRTEVGWWDKLGIELIQGESD